MTQHMAGVLVRLRSPERIRVRAAGRVVVDVRSEMLQCMILCIIIFLKACTYTEASQLSLCSGD